MRKKGRYDRVRRVRYAEKEIEERGRKAIERSEGVREEVREEIRVEERKKREKKTRIRKYCRETGKARGIVEGISRQEWKQRGDKGEIGGIRRGTW